jgi:biopolymer transport protein ExbB/TolQ
MNIEELLHYLRLGGITMAIILVSSLVALAVAIERIIALWGVGDQAKSLAETIARNLLRGDVAAAKTAAQRSNAVAADIYLAGFGRLDRNGTASATLDAAVDRERMQVGLKLKRNLWILGTIGATAPFVGLFGTVTGIMRSFRDLGLDVQGGGTGGTQAVMSGISEALVATAAGILVAVEAVVLYNYFQARIGRIAIELKLLADEFVELLREKPANPPVTAGSPESTAIVGTAPGEPSHAGGV